MKNFFSSIKSYSKNPNNFTGKPQLPNYKDKNSTSGFSLDKGRFTKEGVVARVITEDNINQFSSIVDKTNVNKLYNNSLKEELLKPDNIRAYNEFRFIPFIDKKVSDVLTKDLEELDYFYRVNQVELPKEQLENLLTVEFAELKITPLKIPNKFNHTVKIEVVLKHTVKLLTTKTVKVDNKNNENGKNKNLVNLPNSFLSQILKVNSEFLDLTDPDKVEFIQKHFKKSYNKHVVASLDLGIVNHAALTFNNGEKGQLTSGQKYRAHLKTKGKELDKRISFHTPQAIKTIQSTHDKNKAEYEIKKLILIETIENSPEYKELVEAQNSKINKSKKKKTNVEKNIEPVDFIKVENKDITTVTEKVKPLTPAQYLKSELDKQLSYPAMSKSDKALLKHSYQALNNVKEIVNLRAYIKNYKNQHIHQLSDKLLDLCIRQQTSMLIVGKNVGWKNGINIGRTNNRDFYNFPHSEFIKLLQYKALKYGIVVLTVEESYTSKTSFMNNSKLKSYKDKILIEDEQNREKETLKTNNDKNFNNNVNDIAIKNIAPKNEANKDYLNPASNKTIATNLSSLNKDKKDNNHQNDLVENISLSIVKPNPKKNMTDLEDIARAQEMSNSVNNISIYGGTRSDRNTFKNTIIPTGFISTEDCKDKKTNKKYKIVHADINGSFNISRKVFPHIKYDKKRHNMHYKIYALQSNKENLRLICG